MEESVLEGEKNKDKKLEEKAINVGKSEDAVAWLKSLTILQKVRTKT